MGRAPESAFTGGLRGNEWRAARWLVAWVVAVVLAWPRVSPAAGVAELIRSRVVDDCGALLFAPPGTALRAPLDVERFYRHRAFAPAWSNDNQPTLEADLLVEAIRGAEREGLVPGYYHLAAVSDLLAQARRAPPPAALLTDLDLLLTDAFLLLGCHYSSGCVSPVTVEARWYARGGLVDMGEVLEQALAEERVDVALQRLLPRSPAYRRLRDALERYRALATGDPWPTLPEGPLLRSLDIDPRVRLLRARLAVTGDLPGRAAEGDRFDRVVEAAVRRFQERHGLVVDGVVGPSTRRALNVPASARVRQIEINLERLRWSPDKSAGRVILINIADFRLEVIEHGHSLMTMRVVVGKPYWHTPVFSGQLTYLVLNPSWNLPPNITAEEILPEVRRDPDYVARRGIHVVTGWGAATRVVDARTVDWATVDGPTSAYRFQQPPGPANPLGRIKFVLPNPFHVYLHDSPARQLFDQPVRAFSHGCIRVEKAVDLALYVLHDSLNWNRDTLMTAIHTGEEQTIHLREPIDVSLLYLTAWADEEGRVQFREDIYGRDGYLDRALRQQPPSAS